MLSIGTITVLSYQRYNMVTKDLQFPVSTHFSSFVTLIFIWTYAFLLAIPPILGWGAFDRNVLGVRSARDVPNEKIIKCFGN